MSLFSELDYRVYYTEHLDFSFYFSKSSNPVFSEFYYYMNDKSEIGFRNYRIVDFFNYILRRATFFTYVNRPDLVLMNELEESDVPEKPFENILVASLLRRSSFPEDESDIAKCHKMLYKRFLDQNSSYFEMIQRDDVFTEKDSIVKKEILEMYNGNRYNPYPIKIEPSLCISKTSPIDSVNITVQGNYIHEQHIMTQNNYSGKKSQEIFPCDTPGDNQEEPETAETAVEPTIVLEEALMPIFKNDEDNTRSFIKAIEGAKPTAITGFVNEWVKRGYIHSGCQKGELWQILHNYGKYQCTKNTWNKQVK